MDEVVADGVASLLRLARDLLVDSYFAFQYSLVAAGTALAALEACLRGCLPVAQVDDDRRTLGPLINEAEGSRRGLITAEEAAALRNSAKFRNLIAHGKIITHEDPGKSYVAKDALVFIESVHEAISDLYQRVARRQAN